MSKSSIPGDAHPNEVLWLPALPAEGSLSMDRYWKELELQRRAHPPAGLSIRSALSQLPVNTRRASRPSRAWQKYVSYPLKVRQLSGRAKLVHILDHAFAGLLRHVPAGVRKVVTVHDLAPLVMPGSLSTSQQERFRRSVGWLRQADLVLADSAHTARDVVSLLNCKAESIHVLPLGADLIQFRTPHPAPLPDWDARFSKQAPVISVGSVGERKNLKMLPAFLARLRTAGWPVALVRVGDALPADLAHELRIVLGEGNLIELGKISTEHLAGAYQRASMLVFPSLLEGFGLPVIEAMAAGCPVICSDASSLPEVGGMAALYFHPEDTEAAIAQGLHLLGDEITRRERIRTASEWSERFSWDAHFAALTGFYQTYMR